MAIIKTNNLTKSYNHKKVVNEISLEVNEKEIYGFLGRNGAGKSTFINMITGIILPTSGSFELLGEANVNLVKKRIGVLPDYSTFYDSMSAIDHLKFYSNIQGLRPSKNYLMETLEVVGLTGNEKQKVGKFSFGMKKKLGIAQAIINKPELLFLDEPTSGVDAESAIQIKQLIKKLNSEGRTIFMTSHNLNEVEEICSRIAIMSNGEIRSQGTLQEIKSNHTNSLLVKVRVQEVIKDHVEKEISSFLEANFGKFHWESNYLTVEIENESEIPVILRTLMQRKVDVFEVNVIEPSLEEVFLEKKVAI
ncbi:ABC transporter ATP-binding protein [Halobacillus sp. A5]|uniref:ABC transporter ATP-binding protein n=1 Tax=Halobacillus sp. A5 TaxID=2880263 RepID=UPI0020A6C780|nr:ABC transporter ATP-binding protein [Halobacillus sp. A5]MCP3029629.1 ABC transporter ATP-binding protein [Halobacillus sp. A5]